MGFVDKEKYEILVEKLEDLYRGLGLSIEHSQLSIDEDGEPHLMIISHVRETAYERVTQDREQQQAYNKMVADQAEANLDHRKQAIAKAIESGDIFGALSGTAESDCAHTNQHEGLCLDCGQELE